ncbi:polysaccharide biosynthesis/export family protein [Bosea sp. (in: a-proteobacteria)]|nr:polysaccharide biosynthesis/export family protein [Bosea sp. (in: a-proteobacteria)]
MTVTQDQPATEAGTGYLLIDLNPTNITVLERLGPKSQGDSFASLSNRQPTLLFGVGDLVNVTIFEAAAGGLFIPAEAGSRAGNFVTLPVQEVDRNGMIQVPFAGAVKAQGQTPGQVKEVIEARLRNRAIEPQAVVTLQESRSTLVTVTGDATAPSRFPLSRSSDRILDVISRAGGSKWPPYETYVTLQRGNLTRMIYFNRLVNEPRNNIYVQPGDVLSISRLTRSFMALGASGQNGFINFEAETLTLTQGVGRAGGILDSRGDPAQTFLYRMENRRTLQLMGYDTSGYPREQVPVIYRVNLRDPQGYFLATKFPMSDKDILFVSNAQTVELTKFLQLLQLTGNTVSDADAARIILKGYSR